MGKQTLKRTLVYPIPKGSLFSNTMATQLTYVQSRTVEFPFKWNSQVFTTLEELQAYLNQGHEDKFFNEKDTARIEMIKAGIKN